MVLIMRIWGLRFRVWGPYNKEYSILGSILGSPYVGKLPYTPYEAIKSSFYRPPPKPP